MPVINKNTTYEEMAAIVSDALEQAGITATLSGGGAVTIYSANEYQSHDLDFVTANRLEEIKPVLERLGFVHRGTPRLSHFEHPDVAWYLEFPPAPLAFGDLLVQPSDCSILRLPVGELRVITPTQCVMDRLAASFAWHEAQSMEQAIMVAARHPIDWQELADWFENEGIDQGELTRFRQAVKRKVDSG